MKKFTKAGAKFAAAAAVSVMALGYTTSVWAEENTVVKIGKEFADIKGTQTENMPDIFLPFEPADNVKGIGLDIHNVEKLNIIDSDEDGLFISGRADAYKRSEVIGVHVKDAQANFDINGDLLVLANGVIRDPEENVQSQVVIQGTEADLSMRAVGFYGEKGSSQIKAKYVSSIASNRVAADSTEKLKEETLGMYLNKYTINILAKENIEISSLIPMENMLAGEKTAQGMVLSNRSKASLHADGDISISAAVGYGAMITRVMPAISVGHVNGIHAVISTENMLAGEKTAQGMILNRSKASLQAKEDISISAAVDYGAMITRVIPAISVGHVNGIHADSSELDMQAGGKIIIKATINGYTSNNNLAAINASNSKINMKAVRGIQIAAVNKDGEGFAQTDKVYAIVADNQSEITLDSGSSEISIRGNVNVSDNSTLELSGKREFDDIGICINGNVNVSKNSVLKLSGVTVIGEGLMRSATSGSTTSVGNLNVDNSKLVVDGFTGVFGSTTLNKAKIYLYDDNNTSEGFHALSIIGDLNISENNELFLRADSSKAAGDITRLELNSDVIGISGNITTITGDGKFNVNVFDKGMKNGYGMSKDGTKVLDNPITVLYNSNPSTNPDFASLINSVKVTNYDNGIWSYTYDDMRADKDENGNVVINKVKVTAAPSASGSQRSLHSANKAAGALAIGVLGNDNALHAHLREAQGAGEREEVWAQYLGGKLKSDGMQLKHNGVELGYDAYVGNNWTFGVSGMQTRGNTQLDSGSGKAKTNVGTVYGAWHGGSTYLNLEAKAGRVSSESKTFGGTVLQKIAGEFSAPAYSVSAEYGSTHELPAAWYLEPAVRLSYVHLGAADYGVQVQDTLARVANDSLDSFILRGGAKLGRRLGAKGSFYVKAAALYDFGGDLATTVSADGRTAHYEDSLGGWGVEYGAGLEYKLGRAANISLDVERRSGGELKRDWGVNIGVNYSF